MRGKAPEEGSRNEANCGSEPQSSSDETKGCGESEGAVFGTVPGPESVVETAVAGETMPDALIGASTVPVVPVIPARQRLV
jgi:hypothetical protein